VDGTLDELKGANFYTHLDLAFGFWQLRVRAKDVHKTSFQTPDGLMEWVAMLLGLCNAPTTFQRMMNDIQRDFLHKLVVVYLDDVYIYIRTLEGHLEHRVRLVFQRFKEEGLKLRRKKCFIDLQEMEYLGYSVSSGKISVSTKKVDAVTDWQVQTLNPKPKRRFAVSCNLQLLRQIYSSL
jgi:hypothetical protein